MNEIKERIKALRKRMKEKKIDIYYIPNEDDHLSEEYTADYFKCKSYFSGFSGEAGCTIITQKFAGLWTDGRYFTQAEKELKGTGVTLMRLRQEGVLDPVDFLVENTPKNGTLGFDGKVVSTVVYTQLVNRLQNKKAKVVIDEDLCGDVWVLDRPQMPLGEIFILPTKYTGADVKTKVKRLRDEMKRVRADVMVLTQLEDPCWLLNVRGDDIDCTPVMYSFCIVTKNTIQYYINPKKLNKQVKEYFKKEKVIVKKYDAISSDLKKLKKKTIWADLRYLNAYLSKKIDKSNKVLNRPSPVLRFRACKNDVEVKNIRNAHVKDGVAMAKFLYWLKENVGKMPLTEIAVENKLYELRSRGKDYITPSFHTISAYKGNAAMMHYSASPTSNAKLKPEGFLLVDSGGTYYDGTTDITRTISLGKLTKEEKKYFTMVLKSHLRLSRAKFLYGTTGQNLDILARGVIWDMDIDYQCGTGHGVGHVLGVHEGPHGIRWGIAKVPAVLEPGMVVTNEPGIYLPHKLGIRTENELLVVKGKKNFYGQFLEFETITYCPYDLDAIDYSLMSKEELNQMNEYHAMVYKKISPYLTGKEKAWLKHATRKVNV